jgi:hypothetical protein
MRILGMVLGMAGLAGAGMSVLAPAARAVPPGVNCSGGEVVSAASVRRFGGSPVVGSIQLRRDSCSRYWAQVLMDDQMPPNAMAVAYLVRYRGGKKSSTLSCDSHGGTGRVLPGQTTCRTPKVTSTGGEVTFIASAHELHNGGGGYTRVSWGQTRRMR